jgi:RimJ/RimL family protein N-acetyltransferase
MHTDAPTAWKAPRPLPEQVQTPRLLLRAWKPEDAPSMLAALNIDRASYLPWLPWVRDDNQDISQCIFNIERMRRHHEAHDDNFVLGIFDRHTGEAVGGTGLHRIDAASHTAEIGYWVRPDRRGQGLCTEAVAHHISWALRDSAAGGWGLRRLVIFCAGPNEASQRVPRKLGLRQEVTQRAARFVPGHGWTDTLGWGVLREEWDAERHRVR